MSEAMKIMRQERVGVKEIMAAELHHGFAGARESEPIALTNS